MIAQRALRALADILGIPRSVLDPLVIDYHLHSFGRDPYALGAYSFVRVGGSAAPIQLQEPEAETLLLAGEYTEKRDPGTVAAAIASGRRAARTLDGLLG